MNTIPKLTECPSGSPSQSQNQGRDFAQGDSYSEERRKVLRSVEDTLPRIIQTMEAANIRLHGRVRGLSASGVTTNELSELWGAVSRKNS